MQTSRESLGGRLRRARHDGFVGRAPELARLRQALHGDVDGARVLLVHGPGGIGKTTLLERVAHEAAEAERPVVRVDATPDVDVHAAMQQAAAAGLLDRPALVVDGLERWPDAARRLRDEVLPALPHDAVAVLAGRRRPGAEWTADPGWRALVDVVQVGPLDESDCVELLRRRDVPRRLHPALLRFAGGNPLALALAADDAEGLAAWQPDRRVVRLLLDRLVETPPTRAAAVGLDVCAHARHTTVELLRAVMDHDDASAAFEWLNALPSVESGPGGLRLDDLARRLLDADHRWRDPGGYDALHRSLWEHLAERAVEQGADGVREAVTDLVHLKRYRHPERHESGALTAAVELVEMELDDDVAAAVLDLAEAVLGREQRAHVEHWLQRRPEGFSVFGLPGGSVPVSFIAWLRLGTDDDVEADPLLGAVRERLADGDPLRDGDEVAVARFVVPRPRTAHLAATDPRLLRWYDELVGAADVLAASYAVLPDLDAWVPFMTSLDHHLASDLGQQDGEGPRWGLFEHDWRRVPMPVHLQRVMPAVGDVADADAGVRRSLPREAFEEALRQLLRDWHDDDAVAANVLARSALGGGREGEPAEVLRDAVTSAAGILQDDPRTLKQHRALSATYLHQPGVTQEAAAARLGLPFSTYRRHLSKGVSLVADRLWARSRD